MTTIELKKQLIQRIAAINDESFLKAVKTILDAKTQANTLKLTKNQVSEINESRDQIARGLFKEQSELDKEFNKWANAK